MKRASFLGGLVLGLLPVLPQASAQLPAPAPREAGPQFGLVDPALPPLPKGFQRLGDVPMGHPTAVAAHFPVDGKTLLSAGYEEVREWDLATKSLIRRYRLEGVYPRQLTSTPDGRFLVVRDGDSVRVMNRADGKPAHTLRAEDAEDRIEAAAVSPDGKTLAVGTWNGVLSLRDTASGRPLAFRTSHPKVKPAPEPFRLVEPPRHPPRITHIAFSPDGRTVASAADGDVIRAWDVATARELWALDPADSRAAAFAFTPDGRHVFAPKAVPALRKKGPGGRIIAAPSGVGGYALWSVADRRSAVEYHGAFSVYHAAVSADGRFVAAGGGDCRFRVWDAATGAVKFGAPVGTSVCALEFSRDGKFVACVGYGLGLWELASGREVLGTNGHTGPVGTAAVSAGGKKVVTGGSEGTVRVWDATTRKVLAVCAHDHSVARVALSPDGSTVASTSADGTARLWAADTGRELRRFEFANDMLGDLAFSPDGRLLAVCGRNLTVHLFDPRTGDKKAALVGYDGFSQAGGSVVRFSPDGKHLAALLRRGAGAIGDPIRESYATPVAASPFDPALGPAGPADGKWRVALWDVATGRRVRLLGPASEHPPGFAFTPDGERLAVGAFGANDVEIVAVKDGTLRHQVETKGTQNLLFTRAGDLFAGSTCYDPETGRKLAVVPDDRPPLAVFPDGRNVVLWTPDGPSILTLDGQ